MTERKLGVGVIGAGGIARLAHLPNYVRNPRVKLVAVADIDVAKARQVAEDFGIPNVYDNFEELLANPEVEAVSVTTPPSAHAETGDRGRTSGQARAVRKADRHHAGGSRRHGGRRREGGRQVRHGLPAPLRYRVALG